VGFIFYQNKEVKMPEGRERENIEQSELDYINAKRTYDTYQDLDVQKARFNQQVDQDIHALVMQTLQNGVESANMVSKQAIRHADLAIDRQWNVDEVAQLVAKTPVFLDAIAAKVVSLLFPED